jgi:hypothetical protein
MENEPESTGSSDWMISLEEAKAIIANNDRDLVLADYRDTEHPAYRVLLKYKGIFAVIKEFPSEELRHSVKFFLEQELLVKTLTFWRTNVVVEDPEEKEAVLQRALDYYWKVIRRIQEGKKGPDPNLMNINNNENDKEDADLEDGDPDGSSDSA